MSPTANKFITIYNNSSGEARSAILDLVSLLAEFKAPRILTDFQCGRHSPVHYRFGAFKKIRRYDKQNKKLLYLIKDNTGNFVEDKRLNYPILPTYVKPLFTNQELEDHFLVDVKTQSQSNTPITNYNMECILKKSNRGNVYRASLSSTHQKVIIKQCRPFLSYDFEGKYYANDELRNEALLLQSFESKTYTGYFIEDFYISDDYFVVQDFIDGVDLLNFLKQSNIDTNKRIGIMNKIVDILNDIHSEGYKIGDLSPSNFLYSSKTDDVFLIDLENLEPITTTVRNVHTPFFVNPDVDLKQSTIGQVYFALCMLGYSIFTSGTLKFLKGDSKYHITVLNKIEQLLELSHTQGQLT
ncbi:TPA: protein kinase family protein, partial [Streptococcus pneumoniae]|nr:protein kinase family protein [Streptococcus pneumoniae]